MSRDLKRSGRWPSEKTSGEGALQAERSLVSYKAPKRPMAGAGQIEGQHDSGKVMIEGQSLSKGGHQEGSASFSGKESQ